MSEDSANPAPPSAPSLEQRLAALESATSSKAAPHPQTVDLANTIASAMANALGPLMQQMATVVQAKPAAPAPAPTPPHPSQNFSDKGPAASSMARDPLAVIQHDPRKATMDDFKRLAVQHGQQKALEMWTANTMEFLRHVKVRPDRGGGR